jgi:D-alanine-D-alanine ligase
VKLATSNENLFTLEPLPERMKKRIAIVYGGYSSEWVISEKSAKVVLSHLDSSKYECYLVHIANDDWSVVLDNGEKISMNRNDFSFELAGSTTQFDAVFNAIHGTPGEDGILQGYFDILQIPYTSAGVMASSLTFSKSYCNGFLRQFNDVNIATSVLVNKGEEVDANTILDQVGLPCFVKPNNGGSSFGVTKLTELANFHAALNHALEDDSEAICEQFIDGREFGSGVYERAGKVIALPITEIISENDYFDYQAKYEGASKEITPAEISIDLSDMMQQTSRKVFSRLNLKGMARVDYIVQNGKPYLIEVNTIPGLSEESILPQQVVCSGITLKDFFGVLIEGAAHSRS